jgi:NAD(P)-dependent dehydrogenase (short-subunit alcohol dehydrogenase family)
VELIGERPVVLVSDGGNPVGLGIASRLRDRGFLVAVNLPGGVDGPPTGSDDLVFVRPAVTAGDAAGLVADVVGAAGRLDALVLTADVLIPVRVEDGEEAVFQEVLDRNVKTAFFLSQAAARVMDQGAGGPGGAIVYVGSIHGEKPTGVSFAYAAAMGALKMLSREAALDLGRRGVRVNLLEVGALQDADQRLSSNLSDVYADYARKIPLPSGPGGSEDVAEAVLFLLSPEAHFLHGAEIRLDGGFTLHYMDHKMRSL